MPLQAIRNLVRLWRHGTSVRKIREGGTTSDMMTEPDAEVGVIHPKAMPAILTTAEVV
jgi:hypothetical protein